VWGGPAPRSGMDEARGARDARHQKPAPRPACSISRGARPRRAWWRWGACAIPALHVRGATPDARCAVRVRLGTTGRRPGCRGGDAKRTPRSATSLRLSASAGSNLVSRSPAACAHHIARARAGHRQCARVQRGRFVLCPPLFRFVRLPFGPLPLRRHYEF
jgi:hypothetical protein